MKKLLLIISTLLLMTNIFLVGCSGEEQSERELLRLGTVPGEEEQRRREQYQPFVEYLERELDMDVELFVGSDYTATVEAMRSNKIDLVWYGPLSYVLAADVADAEAFALSSNEEMGIFYESYIITHSDSDIYEIADLKGKTFGFVDPASTGGHLIPRLSMVENGIDPETDLESMVYLGGHDACAAAVKNKNVDAASIVKHMYEREISSGRLDENDVRIINVSDKFPGGPLAYRKSLDDNLKAAIRHAIFNMSDEDIELCRDVLGDNHTGFEEANDELWNGLRKASELIDLDID